MNKAIIKKHGIQSLTWIATGAIIVSLKGMSLLPSLLVGVFISYIGFQIKQNNKESKYPWFIIGTGIVTMVSAIPFLGKVSNVLLTVAGIGLIAFGVFHGLQFFFKRKREN